MSAYLIVHMEITNWEEFRAYQQGIRSTIKPFGGWMLAASPATMLEGDAFPNHNVIIRFPTQAHVQRWWDSQAYKEIIPLRLENSAGPAQACILPGLDGDVEIAALERYQKKFAAVLGKRMAYVEQGEGDPIVFLHGNPTSSYLWRNVMPHLEGQGRLIAPDLIGMGDSEKLEESGPESYRFVEHRRYLDALLEQLGVERNVTLVVHDWGSALGFDWANRHRDAMKGYANKADFEQGMRDSYGDAAGAMLELYPATEDTEVRGAVNQWLTDTWILRAARVFLDGISNISSSAYQYHFTRAVPGNPLGAHHGAELRYVFNTMGGKSPFGGTTTAEDVALAESMIAYWTQFAKTGNPNLNGFEPWPEYGAARSYLELGDAITSGRALGAERLDRLEAIRRGTE